MTKHTTNKNNNSGNKHYYPLVSVCTPTFNRRPFISNMFECFKNQDYPKHRIEWIIVDDGTDKIRDLIESSNISQIRYFELPEKMSLGAKRNYIHKHVRGSIIVYMDDDDYYPPERISHAVERLQSNPNALCAGSSEMYIYFKHINKMYQCGPYGPNHATAGTFAFKTELLKQTKYEDHAALAEERAFLKDYTIPFVQLDPLKSILVFSHEHNTFDKRKMLENMNPQFMKESDKTVDTFIRKSTEQNIKKFFLDDIVELLNNYEPGQPKMKPDVLVQMKKIEEERDAYIKEQMEKQKANNTSVLLQRPGEEPIQLSSQDIVNLLSQQQNVINQLQQKIQEISTNATPINYLSSPSMNFNSPEKKISELENMVTQLQRQMIEKTKTIQSLTNEIKELKKNTNKDSIKMIETNKSNKSKCEPDILLKVSD
jgi:glycosyltransferase involved in cell wall biosynthesis